MTTLMIEDLSFTEGLDRNAMARVRGGIACITLPPSHDSCGVPPSLFVPVPSLPKCPPGFPFGPFGPCGPRIVPL